MEEAPVSKPLPVTLPTGMAVADNVKRLRTSQGLAFTELSATLEKLGRPIAPLGLRHIESYKRRVDADDLVSLAAALGVSPVTLLMPWVAADAPVTVANTDFLAATLWEWLIAEWPFPKSDGLMAFLSKALPPWKLAAVERRIAERHGHRSVAELEEASTFTVRLEGPADGND